MLKTQQKGRRVNPKTQCFRLLVGSQWRHCRLYSTLLLACCVPVASRLSILCEQHFRFTPPCVTRKGGGAVAALSGKVNSCWLVTLGLCREAVGRCSTARTREKELQTRAGQYGPIITVKYFTNWYYTIYFCSTTIVMMMNKIKHQTPDDL